MPSVVKYVMHIMSQLKLQQEKFETCQYKKKPKQKKTKQKTKRNKLLMLGMKQYFRVKVKRLCAYL